MPWQFRREGDFAFASVQVPVPIVLQMENPRDDPREFTHSDYGDLDGPPPDMDTFLCELLVFITSGAP